MDRMINKIEVENLNGSYASLRSARTNGSSSLNGLNSSNRVIRDLNFSVREGEIYGVIGPNGSGKTTLLRLLSRVLLPDDGEIRIEGKDLRRYSIQHLARMMAVVPQETTVDFSFTAFDIAAMGRAPYSGRFITGRHEKQVIEDSMRTTDTWHLRNRIFNTLSGGEAQRVVIARSLAQKCKILLLDEPTAHLDLKYQSGIFGLLRRLRDEEGITIVLTTHDLNLAALFCDRLFLLHAGRKEVEGTPNEVITHERIKTVYGADCRIFYEEMRGVPIIYPNVENQ
ncbi:MAG: ABC transporter ATP-binding protein [bacterium]